MAWLPSIPYPPSRDGYWHPVTSTLNWCEEASRCPGFLDEFACGLRLIFDTYIGLLCYHLLCRDRQYLDESLVHDARSERHSELSAQWARYNFPGGVLWVHRGWCRQLFISLNTEM